MRLAVFSGREKKEDILRFFPPGGPPILFAAVELP
jgi:hypothetical protein